MAGIIVNINIFSFNIIASVLGINILEAVITDFLTDIKYGWPNATCELLLICILPKQKQELQFNNIFLFHLNNIWVIIYTLWNAVFVYGVGFSLSFCLILLTPLIVCLILNQPNAWLGARTYSLILNQILRGSELLYIYKPGKSYITKIEGLVSTNQTIRLLLGSVNLVLLIGCIYIGLI